MNPWFKCHKCGWSGDDHGPNGGIVFDDITSDPTCPMCGAVCERTEPTAEEWAILDANRSVERDTADLGYRLHA